MIYNDQLILHDPDNGKFGDCARTVLSCLLDIPPNDVPHFAEHHRFRDTHREAQRVWLRENRGLDLVTFYLGDIDNQHDRRLMPHGLCMAGGPSPRGYHGGHMVVWHFDASGGHLVHAPHPTRAGLAGDPEDVTFLVKVV